MRLIQYYLLNDDHSVTTTSDMKYWSEQFASIDRNVGKDTINGCFISTAFIGLDHEFSNDPDKPPLIFETMVFSENPDFDGYQARCSTWKEALEIHENTVNQVKFNVPFNNRPIKKLILPHAHA